MEDALDSNELSSFSVEFSNYGPLFRHEILACLDVLSSCDELGAPELSASITNDECRLDLPSWGAMFDSLIEDKEQAPVRIRTWGRQHLLLGAQCEVSVPLGRVVSEEDFLRSIANETNLNLTTVQCALEKLLESDGDLWRRGIDFLRNRVNPTLSSDQYRPIALAKHVMWGTFVKDAQEPFQGLEDDQIEAALGLEPQDQVMLALVYDLPRSVATRIPTVGEAAASSPWNPNFRPAPAGESQSGWTSPVAGYGVTEGRREVVHKPSEIGTLSSSVRILDKWVSLLL